MSKRHGETTAITALKGTINILSAVLLAMVALLFAVYAYNYKSLAFIAQNYALTVWLTVGGLAVIVAAYLVCFLMKKQSAHRLLLCLLICLDVIAVLFYVVCATGIIYKITSIDALREYIGSFGGLAAVLYILFSFLQVVILPIPGSVTVAAGTALFGPLLCAVYSFVGIVLGSIVAFAVGRVVGYKAVCWIVGKEDLDKWLLKLKGKDYLILSIMFLLPLFPDDVLCFVAGLSSMTWAYFLVMITITRLISVFTTAYSFDLIPFNTWWGILIWLTLFALIAVSFYLVCKYSDQIDKFIKRKFKLKNRRSS